jgi:hypothetical protein
MENELSHFTEIEHNIETTSRADARAQNEMEQQEQESMDEDSLLITQLPVEIFNSSGIVNPEIRNKLAEHHHKAYYNKQEGLAEPELASDVKMYLEQKEKKLQ